MKNPKFKVGDQVLLKRKTLYGETIGTIYEVEKIFKKICDYNENQFEDGGLETLESTIPSTCLPYKFDGETLEITFPAEIIKFHDGSVLTTPEKIHKSKFYGYAYSVKTPKMNTIYSERSLKLL